MRIVDRLRALIAELGALDAMTYLAERVLHSLAGHQCLWKYRFVAQPVAAVPRLPPNRGRSIHVVPVGRDHPQLDAIGRPRSVIEDRFDQGAVCLGAFKDDLLVGCIWFVIGPYNEDEVRCRFVPSPAGQAAWDFDVYLDPKLRTGFAFARLWDEADAYLRARGVAWTMSRISAFNVESLRSHARLGAARVGAALYLNFAGRQLMVSTLSPRVHVSTRADKVPVMPIPAPTGRHD